MRESKKILIVDDNDDIITTYRIVLDRMGYGVVWARDGRECLKFIEEELPDLVLLDVRLPGISGTEVCRLIKEKSRMPVVAITASMSAETREKMEEVGADEFLLKPIDVSDLNRVIKKHLGV